MLYQLVHCELEGFLDDAAARSHPMPLFIQRTFRDYLDCGILSKGFVRVHCDSCSFDHAVAFSCKRRGVCPSCGGRRMTETAADLVDFVLPRVGVRQWVLSLPFELRYRLAYDRTLLTPVLAAFLRAVFRSHQRRIFDRYGVRGGKCGAVTFVQRFGGALNLNVHFHTLVLEGAYEVEPSSARVRFLPLAAPSGDDVRGVLADAAGRIRHQLEKRGLGAECDPSETNALAREDPLLATLYAASVQGRVASGPRAGEPTTRLAASGFAPRRELAPQPLCAVGYGLSLHAGVYVPPTDRRRLERICRYTARPPLATDRLRRLGDGRIRYELRHRWRDGTTHIVFEPRELMARLAALIPPPRQHQVRYHGILAPSAAWRDHVVPEVAPARDKATMGAGGQSVTSGRSWAELMRRVFALDVMQCPRCGGRMRIIAAIISETAIRAILKSLGLDDRAPPARTEQRHYEVEAY